MVALCFTLLPLVLAEPLASQQDAAQNAVMVARAGHFDSALVLLGPGEILRPGQRESSARRGEGPGLGGPEPRGDCPVRQPPGAKPRKYRRDGGPGVCLPLGGTGAGGETGVDAALSLDSTTPTRWSCDAWSGSPRGARWRCQQLEQRFRPEYQLLADTVALAPLADGIRFLGRAGMLEASDPLRDATRVGGEAGFGWSHGQVQATALAGARRLDPETGVSRTEATYMGSLSLRRVRDLGSGWGTRAIL